jgi:ParB family chromosome partitioning protein
MSTEKTNRLGRGLDAIFSAQPASRATDTRPGAADGLGLRQIAVALIRPNPLQPRKEFDPAELKELESSIRANGLLQPIAVRVAGGAFELIAGERRFRAVQRLGWNEIPAIVRDIDDRTLLTLALVENLQRSDLNPMEEAEGYQQLLTQFSLTQQQVADVVGKDRSTVANTLRLLALPTAIRGMVREGTLTIGHARALLALGDDQRMIALARDIVAEGLSVRAVEQRVRESGKKNKSARAAAKSPATVRAPAEISRMEEELRRRLQTDVKVQLTSTDKGEVHISFYSVDDLERVLDIILGATRHAL